MWTKKNKKEKEVEGGRGKKKEGRKEKRKKGRREYEVDHMD